MKKRVQIADLFTDGSSQAPKNTFIFFSPDGDGNQVKGRVIKKNGNTARVQYNHPDHGPKRVDLSLNTMVGVPG